MSGDERREILAADQQGAVKHDVEKFAGGLRQKRTAVTSRQVKSARALPGDRIDLRAEGVVRTPATRLDGTVQQSLKAFGGALTNKTTQAAFGIRC